jgi:hypothetical protein
VFNSRLFLGTIAAAGVFAAGAAVPALATTKPVPAAAAHMKSDLKKVPVVGGALGGVVGTVTGGVPTSGAPVAGALNGLASLPIIGPLLAALTGAGYAPGTMSGMPMSGNPVSGLLHGVTSAVPGLGQITGTATGALKSVGSATGVLKNLPLVGGLTGTVNGALSGITGAVPGLGSITGALPLVGG